MINFYLDSLDYYDSPSFPVLVCGARFQAVHPGGYPVVPLKDTLARAGSFCACAVNKLIAGKYVPLIRFSIRPWVTPLT